MSSTLLDGVYSDGIVLQRNKDTIISGYEDKLAEVKVTLADIEVQASVSEGRFKAVLPPMDAAEGLMLTVEGTDTVQVTA